MKNVTKILTALVLCAAVFASTQRVESLGGNAAFWPGDEANIGAFPAQINNHGFVQLTNVGSGDAHPAAASMVFDHNGTAWGLMSAATQHSSHSRTGNAERTLRSQLDGSRGYFNSRFIH